MAPQQIVLITGASRGLGRSAARHLARAGVGVIGTYQSNRAEAEAMVAEVTASGVPAVALQLDVADASTFDAFTAAVTEALNGWDVEHLHAVVHFAGYGVHAPYTETSAQQLEQMLRVHVSAPFLLTQALLPMMTTGGRILNVSSGLARFTGPGYAAYAAAKGAVEVLTRYQAAELGGRGIRVNTLVPGAIATDFGGGVVRDDADVNRAVAGAIALGRVGEPDDIGAAVPALLSDGLGWATGTRIELSGGQSL
ncbi:SDR family NAD(P)-dependent oxidoreductase [Kineococcus aurantiacus]|uniref:NAD(P)-dependent dehydrogenase (Short-subunit alcohol dehydrogenase family) n=1 Tax=Kineococcus aurantiacus TaxID=37633 RepID=A0A7Y9DQH1_9ACTN|nr:SDR family oxidoreductase [Kineococcus aurantiacus]NYD24930.1 NAD(P)-dependent dehydrogenase (short-subunit alcohol dehydrogenase family) [Kineococcus aurantiacus]